jgi:hypothetical protein
VDPHHVDAGLDTAPHHIGGNLPGLQTHHGSIVSLECFLVSHHGSIVNLIHFSAFHFDAVPDTCLHFSELDPVRP